MVLRQDETEAGAVGGACRLRGWANMRPSQGVGAWPGACVEGMADPGAACKFFSAAARLTFEV